MSKMPKQKPGKSEQVVCTPVEFLNALRRKLGVEDFDIDLAASEENTVCPFFYTEELNALAQPWKVGDGWNFCNPPYGDIEPWVKKAADEMEKGAKTAMLVPASVGANWWSHFVDNLAHVLFLNGRITFVGHKTCYPKDLAILLYNNLYNGGYSIWRWK